ncbi:MAG TPA: hypothetical protein VD689_02685, partial [Nitrosopumilaceae archaeon]|nr:hypothetical protein [Nitrosopumilaceae archaeon]
ITIFVIVFSLLVIPAAYAQLSDRTGLKQVFTIETGGYSFPVELISNFNVEETEFSAEEKKLTFHVFSSLQNNMAEIQIPKNLINGNLTFFVNGTEIFPNVQTSDKISFVFMEFVGNGTNKIEIIGTTYLPEFSAVAPLVLAGSLAGILLLKHKSLIKQ